MVLTTHSMEEADALASRIGIMAGGRLQAVGTPVALKNKFGQGFLVELSGDEVRAGGVALGLACPPLDAGLCSPTPPRPSPPA